LLRVSEHQIEDWTVNESVDDRSAVPRKTLLDGAQILMRVLGPHGFHFEFRGEGKSSGGFFAWGEFVRAERKLEVHFRWNLGMVRYHATEQSAAHDYYMRELGVREVCRYPGFSGVPAAEFEGLAHDLALAEDFLTGTAEVLLRAAAKESKDMEEGREPYMARAVGDFRRIEQLRAQFHAKRYSEVISTAEQLGYPGILSQSERRMIEIASERASEVKTRRFRWLSWLR
jgi:hypothetical protein